LRWKSNGMRRVMRRGLILHHTQAKGTPPRQQHKRKGKTMNQKPKTKLEPIVAVGSCKIVAAQATEEGKPDKLPRIDIEAYNGGVMNVGYWGPVAIDLAGLTAADSVPILYQHSTYSVENILGQTDGVTNDGKALTAAGDMMGDGRIARDVKTLAGNGFKFQASVGVDPLQYSEVEAGADVELNGQTLQGPFTLIAQSKLTEISIVPLGADGSTSARIAAEHGAVAPKTEGVEMKLDANGKPIVDGQDGQPTAEQIRAAAVAEELRIGKVREVAKDHDEIRAKAIDEKWTVEATKMAVLEAQLAAERERNKRPDGVNIKIAAEKPVTPEIMAAAVSLRSGLKDAEKAFGAEACTKANDLRIHSLTDLVRVACAAAGKHLEHSRHETREFLQAAFSTRDIANVLSNVANKFISEGYGTVEQTWRQVAAIRSVVDFKANTGVRLVMNNLLKSMGPGGEIEHGELSDETRTVQADTKALMLGVTRKDIINDDLSVLTDLPRRLGYAAARTFCTDFWAAFETFVEGASFSSSSPYSNETTGALTVTTLGAAEALFLAQTDADGNPIGGELTTLLCGTTAFTPAREIFVSTNLTNGTTSKQPSSNIYVNRFAPAFSRYLKAAPWYLVANPMGMPLMVASFLNGRQEPFVETADADFNTLGVQIRCYYDYGANSGEYRAAVRSTGA